MKNGARLIMLGLVFGLALAFSGISLSANEGRHKMMGNSEKHLKKMAKRFSALSRKLFAIARQAILTRSLRQ